MRRIINGKLYNTDTAILVAELNNNTGDFSQWYEELYKTKKGNWFLYGTGGPLSKYHETRGNTTIGSQCIIALSKEEAKDWLVENNHLDVLEKEFGLPEEA